jgi:hypothetical protein
MANPDHVAILEEGVEAWNAWRKEHFSTPDLSNLEFGDGEDLNDINFSLTNLNGVKLMRAELAGSHFEMADLSYAVLSESVIGNANFSLANLCGAKLDDATLISSNFTSAILEGADLRRADLTMSTFVGTDLSNANLTGCRIYGTSVWEANLSGTIQSNLILSPTDQPDITIDSLEVAQFIYLLLNNQKIRHVIETITSKVVLILGPLHARAQGNPQRHPR